MRAPANFLLRLAAFWLVFYTLFRLWFVLWFYRDLGQGATTWKCFFHAQALDWSMTGYLTLIPAVFYFIAVGAGWKSYSLINRCISGFNLSLVVVLVGIFGANVFLYEEWKTPINHRAISYLSSPRALFDSVSALFLLFAFALYAGCVYAFFRFYKYWVGMQPLKGRLSKNNLLQAPLWLIAIFLLIRGGLGVMPVNESAVYYSEHQFNNHAATNTAWHLAHSFTEIREAKNNYVWLDDARSTRDSLFAGPDPGAENTFRIKEERPVNIVMIVVESLTAQVVEELNGTPDVCPHLSSIIEEGILFERIYSSGYRTDQGLTAVLGGYPAQPDQSIVLQSEKAEKLGSLSSVFAKNGYETLFLYGGELTFANIGVWLRQQQFKKILSEPDFPEEQIRQRWGVDDENLLVRCVSEINQLRTPFFTLALTLSLHPPFDVPYESKWQNGETDSLKFLHSAAFADYAIGQFFELAAVEPWFENTLFLITGDHGSSLPGGLWLDDPVSRRIPLIFYAPFWPDSFKGLKINTIGNHHDIPATLLGLTGTPDLGMFPWSRDLFAWSRPSCSSRSFAAYTNENGLGWVCPNGAGFYFFQKNEWKSYFGELSARDQDNAKAWLQVLYQDFLDK